MSEPVVFGDYTQAELDRQYNQRTLVPDISQYLARWKDESADARASLPCRLDISYGGRAIEKLDLFGAGETPQPCLVFFHGGGWRLLSKQESAGIALTLVPRGVRVAVIDFANADSLDLDGIVDQCRRAVAFLTRQAGEFGVDRARLFLGGHSSGAHLAAMVAATDWRATESDTAVELCGLVAVSGIYDLHPVRLSSRNDYLGLDEAAAERNSPIRFLSRLPKKTIVAYGDRELDEFQRQSASFAASLESAGLTVRTCVGEGLNHFDMGFELYRPGSALCHAMLEMIGAPQSDSVS